MASERRIEKLNQLVREEIAKSLDRGIEFPPETLVTVTRVLISEDLLYAACFISVFGENKKEVMEILSKNLYNIQQGINRRLKIRPVPKIHFALDEEEIRREGVEKSLAELKRKGEV